MNPNSYTAAELNERELLVVHFLQRQMGAVELFRQLTATIAPAIFFERAKILIRWA